MPIFRVVINGREVTAESLDDLEALLDRFPGTHSTPAETHSPSHRAGKAHPDGPWPASRFKDFIGRLTDSQRRMLQELVKSQHGKTARDLAQILGFRDAKVFGPVMAAMSKHAKKTGVRIQDVLTTERIDVGDHEKATLFKAADSFARAAGEAGWPRS
ncbi:MAG TPA: hypothetical protein VGY48_02395 [Vicinamibacterales bacterium]|nr:hypothetical protein [Vicinamibacterales bacterium]